VQARDRPLRRPRRYLHADQDDVDDVLRRIHEVREHDLNAIRLKRSSGGIQGVTGWYDGYAAAN
jgi:hypothetical protein